MIEKQTRQGLGSPGASRKVRKSVGDLEPPWLCRREGHCRGRSLVSKALEVLAWIRVAAR